MSQSSRREFLGTAVAAAGTLAIKRGVHSAEPAPPSELKMGVIGAGWYGMVDAKAALKVGGVKVTAICDVDSDHLTKSADELQRQQGQRPQTFQRYEDLLDKTQLDVVVIGTPPHWHALQLIACLERGLDVYCEKPLAYDIREGQAMVAAVQRHGQRRVQIGFQRRQSQAMQAAAEFIRAGKAGKILQVDARIHYRAGTNDPTPQDPPPSLDWESWCGPGPKIPYSPQVGHMSWRLEKTSGHGHLVDWGIHNIDATRMMLGLGTPKQVTAAGGLVKLQGKITTPDTLTVHFEFEQLPVVWRHRIWGAVETDPEFSNGMFFYGDEATVFASDQRWLVFKEGKDVKPEEFKANSDMGTLHMADFLECVRSRKQPACSVEEGFRSTATVQLGMIAYESGTTVRWDEKTRQILDNPEAAKLLQRDYRPPYVHPYQT